MLLERDELVTDPGEYQLHDFQYQYARLELSSIGVPGIKSTWYACVSLGDAANPRDQVKMTTVGFEMPTIGESEKSYACYKKQRGRNAHGYSYSEFLLRWLRHQSKVRVVFFVENEDIRHFAVQLDNIVVRGRVPIDVDVLGTFFGSVLTTSD